MTTVARIVSRNVHSRRGFTTTSLTRTFATSVVRAQAVPTEKPVLNKDFKIYRWVCVIESSCFRKLSIAFVLQNPDEPAKQPTLQTYTIDLNQCGPMVCFTHHPLSPPLMLIIIHISFWTR